MRKDSVGKERAFRLDMSKSSVQDKVLHCISNDELNHIFVLLHNGRLVAVMFIPGFSIPVQLKEVLLFKEHFHSSCCKDKDYC